MVEKTLGGEGCQDEGDFLKWSKAEWTLVGQVGYFQFLGYLFFDPGFPGYCWQGSYLQRGAAVHLILGPVSSHGGIWIEQKRYLVTLEPYCHHNRHNHQLNHHYDQHHNHHVWQECMRHCEKLGSRAPPVVTSDQWGNLSQFLKPRLYESKEVFSYYFLLFFCFFFSFHQTLSVCNDSRKSFSVSLPQISPPKGIWLPITDQEVEGEWRDFFTNKVFPTPSQPTFTPI